jgi:hypothetical protein
VTLQAMVTMVVVAPGRGGRQEALQLCSAAALQRCRPPPGAAHTTRRDVGGEGHGHWRRQRPYAGPVPRRVGEAGSDVFDLLLVQDIVAPAGQQPGGGLPSGHPAVEAVWVIGCQPCMPAAARPGAERPGSRSAPPPRSSGPGGKKALAWRRGASDAAGGPHLSVKTTL